MALQKDFVCGDGFTRNYWKITKFISDRLVNKLVVSLSLFKDVDARVAHSDSEVNTGHNNFIFDDETDDGMTIAQMYAAVKADTGDDFFVDAVDVL